MNQTNKKFKSMLEKEAKRFKLVLDKEAEKFVESKKHNILSEEKNKIDSGVITTPSSLSNDIDSIFEQLKLEFKSLKKEEYNYLCNLMFIIHCYETDMCFGYYELLKPFLEKFNLSKTEQAEIVGYFLNKTINYIICFTDEDVEKAASRMIEKEVSDVPTLLKKRYRKNRRKNFKEEVANDKNNCRSLRNILSEEGDILPFEYALELSWVFQKTDFFISPEYIDLILNESYARFQTIKQQEAESNAKQNAIRLKEKQAVEDYNQTLEMSKEQKKAIQKLKNYLNNDLPIRFILEDEMDVIIGLLKEAGYTETQIIKIKKTIIENNQMLIEERNAINFEQAKLKYLSIEEIDILVSAEKIILELNAQKSPLFKKILDDYNYVKEQLTCFFEANDDNNPSKNDDAELLILYIKELGDTIIEYNYSDYRLLLSKNSN